jgi:hypothetical protein
LSERDIAQEFARLIEPAEGKSKNFNATEFFSRYLTDSPIGPLLFVLDNFETVRSPVETFIWLDTYVRSPSKILITTRFRDFKGDYPEDVHGMSEDEFGELVSQTSAVLGVTHLIDDPFRDELYSESEGHPYVAKVLLGEVAKAGRLIKIERIVAHRDDILPALFERTFANLTPAAQRIFLTLCRWRSTIPLVGLEAVLLRPDNERMDVDSAVEELLRSSMIERRDSPEDGQVFVSVPLVASVFGARKLETSILKTVVDGDMRFLHAFGAAQQSATSLGIEPRIRRLFEAVAGQIAAGRMAFDEVGPVLEYISRRYAPGWFYLADLYEEQGSTESLRHASESIRRFLESAGGQSSEQRYDAWSRLVALARRRGDALEEIQALAEVSRLAGVPFDIVSLAANRMNWHFAQHQVDLDSDAKTLMIKTVIQAMEHRIAEAGATDLSRLAWLHLNTRDDLKAKQYVLMGLELDPNNEYCIKLAQRLGVYW